MENDARSDNELLSDWLEQGREPAFHALVRRYQPLVHMAAWRSSGNDNLAAEASQLTFILLARKAGFLAGRKSLAGWLHLTAVMQVKNLVRQTRRESCKRQHLLAAMEADTDNPAGGSWREIQPLLDEALAALPAKDREALLLRFYRSLSVREIGAALGIATDAAQKRVDRAMVKLRARLARGGCHAGGAAVGSLTAVLIAGFAADAQAALPASSALAAKALSAGGAASASGSAGLSTLLKFTLLKNTSLIPPALVLLLAAAWIGGQRRAIASLAENNAALETRIASRASPVSAKPPNAPPGGRMAMPAFLRLLDGKAPIDWKQMAVQVTEWKAMGIRDNLTSSLLDHRISSLSGAEFVAAWKEIHSAGLSGEQRSAMEFLILEAMSRTSPEATLAAMAGELKGGDDTASYFLADALRRWVGKEPEKAAAWLDAQIAAGAFDTKSLDGGSRVRDRFVGNWMAASLRSDPEGVIRRLNSLPPEARPGVFTFLSFPGDEFTGGLQQSYVDLIRGTLPEADQTRLMGRQAGNLAYEGLDKVTEFLDRVAATPAERSASAEPVAREWINYMFHQKKPTPETFTTIRDWVRGQAPDKVESATGAALGAAAGPPYQRLAFADAAALAIQYQEASGRDEGLVSFLSSGAAMLYKADARQLASRIRDGKRRGEVLRNLDNPPAKP